MEKSYGRFGEAGSVLFNAIDDSSGNSLLESEVDDILGHVLNQGWELQKIASQPEAGKAPRCRYCGDIQAWEGDAPIPEPLNFFDKGLIEHHCGYEGAPSPRFSFVCPVCASQPVAVDSGAVAMLESVSISLSITETAKDRLGDIKARIDSFLDRLPSTPSGKASKE